MATTVDEIMNRELFTARPADLALQTVRHILSLGISGAPVIDEEGRPVGVVSMRDLVLAHEEDTAADRMTSPVVVIREDAPIKEAARLLGETGFHRVVVVDDDGKAVGIVSALDVVRGLVGLPASHPSAFPHYDPKTGVTWSDDVQLDLGRVDSAPDGPGILILIYGGAGIPETVVWGESAENVRSRLIDLVSTPQTDAPLLAYWLDRGNLRFRAAALGDPLDRQRALQAALDLPAGNLRS